MDKEVYILSSFGYYIHLSCNDSPYIPARRHIRTYPLRNFECNCHRFYADYSSMVSIIKRQINRLNNDDIV